jgi:zinc protease
MTKSSPDALKTLGIKLIGEAKGISEYKLANGLKVLLKENHSAPVISFMIVYRVGSRNEAVGNTGSTHFLEHMMFKGTNKFSPEKGNGVMETFSRVGGLLNATTWLDRTNYFECVGSEHLELCIEIEADRMRNLRLRQEDRDSEMTVVRNEFERGENDPGDALDKELNAIAFREHPYHHPTIGWRTDVEGVPMERLRNFYDTYYWPNNATVIAVGDFNSADTLKTIAKHFGKIPSSSHQIPLVYTMEPPQEGERRFELKRSGELPLLVIAYHTPQADHKDTYALAALRAILGDASKPSSRLYKRLMETGLVTSCYSSNGEFHDPALFEIGATLPPNTSFVDVEAAIYDELDKLSHEPVLVDELKRAKSANRKGTILANADPMAFTNMLCQAEASADWRWLINYDDNFDAVTKDDIMRVATTYFHKDNRTVGYFIPTHREPGILTSWASALTEANQSLIHEAESAVAVTAISPAKTSKAKATVTLERVKLAKPKKDRASFSSQVVREVLPNGLTLLVMPNRGTGSVAITGAIVAGDYFAPFSKSALAALTAAMMIKGSKKYSKTKLAQVLEEMGSRFGFSTDNYKCAFGTLITSEDFKQFIPVMADVMREPLFLTQELIQTKREVHASLLNAHNNTSQRAHNALMQAIYSPEHPFYEKTYLARIDELDTTKADDLKSFFTDYMGPASTILTIVGDIDPKQAIDYVQNNFSDWKGPKSISNPESARKTIKVPEVKLPGKKERIEVELADKANVDIVIGHPTNLIRTNDDFYAAYIANAALGQDTISSRLGKVLRVQHGLTYGIYSYFDDTTFGASPWTIGLSVNPSVVDQSLELVNDVVTEYMQKGITDEELEDEAGRAVGSFNVQLRSSGGIAQALTRFEFMGLGTEGMDKLADSFLSVTKVEVNAAMQKYFHPEKAVTVIAGTLANKEKSKTAVAVSR